MNTTIIEKVAALPPRLMVAFVKTSTMKRHEIYQLICALAEDRREPGQSSHSAFAKFITRDPLGMDLYQINKSMPGSDVDASAFKSEARRDVDIRKNGGTEAELNRKAAELMSAVSKDAKAKPLTFAQAFTKVYTDPTNRDLVGRYKDEQQARLARIAAGA
jgi:hypothetical protein